MFRPIAVLLIVSLVSACQNRPQPEIDQPEKPQTQESASSEDPTPDRAMNFASPGVYSGELPCANCEAIRTKVKLTEQGQYFRTRKYLGQTKPNLFEEKGHFTWDKETRKIVLQDAEEPNQYLLEDGQLHHLDREGAKITGDLADKYILQKR